MDHQRQVFPTLSDELPGVRRLRASSDRCSGDRHRRRPLQQRLHSLHDYTVVADNIDPIIIPSITGTPSVTTDHRAHKYYSKPLTRARRNGASSVRAQQRRLANRDMAALLSRDPQAAEVRAPTTVGGGRACQGSFAGAAARFPDPVRPAQRLDTLPDKIEPSQSLPGPRHRSLAVLAAADLKFSTWRLAPLRDAAVGGHIMSIEADDRLRRRHGHSARLDRPATTSLARLDLQPPSKSFRTSTDFPPAVRVESHEVSSNASYGGVTAMRERRHHDDCRRIT